MNAPHFDLGGTGEPLHFLHANGYPPECYNPLLELLKTHYHVFGMLLRPLWKNSKLEEVNSWHIFSDDLLRFISDYESAPVIGVGHSIGAIVTLRAALRDPSKFRALILIDPVLFTPQRLVGWKVQRAKDPNSHPLIQGALRRRRTFTDLESIFQGYRERDVFRYISDENLRIYIEGITQPSATGGYELVFSPEWEAHIYYTGLQDFDLWNNLENLKVPTLFLRGAETDTFLEEAANLVKRKQPKAWVETLDKSTHLLPLERPKEAFNRMQSFLKEVL
jgi:pimeloyl-ACP methyl ester carboxylesterase